MSVTQETRVTMSQAVPEISLTTPSDRRADIESKQLFAANLLKEVGCDGLLVLSEENFAWLTGGGIARGILDPEGTPGLYLSAEGRWLICNNVDTQRIFDEEIDGLGFQLKEWPWYRGRQQLVADLCQGRNVACDQPLGTCKLVAKELQRQRRLLTEYEQACYRARTNRQSCPGGDRTDAGPGGHGTRSCRSTKSSVAAPWGDAAQHHGGCRRPLPPVPPGGVYGAPLKSYGVLTVTARKYGLFAQASRTVVFGPPEANLRRDHDAACKVSATYVASSWPDSVPRQILTGGQRIYQIAGAEHEWTLAPQGHLTGRAVVEMMLTPQNEELLQSNSAITWNASVGAAVSCDTFLISEEGPRSLTAAENWPLKRIRIQGAEFVRPDLLIR